MILDNDQQVQDSIIDTLPITTDYLKSTDWKYVSSSSYYVGGGRYTYWHIWKYGNSYIDHMDKCFYFRRFRESPGMRVDTVKELKEQMYRF